MKKSMLSIMIIAFAHSTLYAALDKIKGTGDNNNILTFSKILKTITKGYSMINVYLYKEFKGKIVKYLLATSLILFSINAFAGTWLAKGATVESVWSTNNNTDSFYVKLSGQDGPCSEVQFYASKSQSPQAYSHAFSLFATALIHNKKVNVLSYEGVSCDSANFVSIHK